MFHGMSRWAWEVVQHQGRMRPAYTAQDGERLYKVVEDRGYVYFCDDLDTAAIYAVGNPAIRFTWWVKGFPTPIGRGRWTLPGGVANQDGVVIAGEFDPGELTYNHRPNSHDEYVTDRPVGVDRLRVVAFIPKGSKVSEAIKRGEQPPPLSAAERKRLESIDRDGEIAWPGPLIADVVAAQQPLRLLKRIAAAGAVANPEAAQRGDWRAALERLTARRAERWRAAERAGRSPAPSHPSIGRGHSHIPPIGSPPQLLPRG
jgi:hypothetical protein